MSTDKENELQEKLQILNVELEGEFQSALDSNADIVGATKRMAHNLLTIRNAHLNEADRLFEMVKMLAESALITADMIGDMVAAEWGITNELLEEDEDDEEGNDDGE